MQSVEPKINKETFQTSKQNQDDLKQEMNILVEKKVRTYPLDEVPGFEEFVKESKGQYDFDR